MHQMSPCPSTRRALKCELDLGHGGLHSEGGLYWVDGSVVAIHAKVVAYSIRFGGDNTQAIVDRVPGATRQDGATSYAPIVVQNHRLMFPGQWYVAYDDGSWEVLDDDRYKRWFRAASR